MNKADYTILPSAYQPHFSVTGSSLQLVGVTVSGIKGPTGPTQGGGINLGSNSLFASQGAQFSNIYYGSPINAQNAHKVHVR